MEKEAEAFDLYESNFYPRKTLLRFGVRKTETVGNTGFQRETIARTYVFDRPTHTHKRSLRLPPYYLNHFTVFLFSALF